MKVSLFVSCLVDQLRPEVGEATARVLTQAGCEVSFDARQTCCGQPAYNSGYRAEACAVASHFLDVYADNPAPIVVPSGSCTAMVKHFPELFQGDPRRALAQEIAGMMGEDLKFELVGASNSRPGHDDHYGLDGTKLREMGWEPPVSFEDSMAETIRWQQDHPEWMEVE